MSKQKSVSNAKTNNEVLGNVNGKKKPKLKNQLLDVND